jgi:DNA-binding phage protein
MSEASGPYQPELLKALADPEEAAEYLNAALADGSAEVVQVALRNVIEARGLFWNGEEAPLARLAAILRGVGLELSFEARKSAA